jgi:hypothetical protein
VCNSHKAHVLASCCIHTLSFDADEEASLKLVVKRQRGVIAGTFYHIVVCRVVLTPSRPDTSVASATIVEFKLYIFDHVVCV